MSSDNDSDGGGEGQELTTKLSIKLSNKELKYRNKQFPDINQVSKCALKCTVCSKSVGEKVLTGQSCFLHSALGVLVCKECNAFYGDGDFSCDTDGDEKYCRWCAQGGQLFLCDKCSCSFCKKCVKRNLSRKVLQEMTESKNWQCFICKPDPLYDMRAQAWAAYEVFQRKQPKRRKPTLPVSRKEVKGQDSSSTTSTESQPDKKLMKVGRKFYIELLGSVQEFSKNLNIRSKEIIRNTLSKSNFNSVDDVFTKSEKIKKFLGKMRTHVDEFEELLDNHTLEYKKMAESQINTKVDFGKTAIHQTEDADVKNEDRKDLVEENECTVKNNGVEDIVGSIKKEIGSVEEIVGSIKKETGSVDDIVGSIKKETDNVDDATGKQKKTAKEEDNVEKAEDDNEAVKEINENSDIEEPTSKKHSSGSEDIFDAKGSNSGKRKKLRKRVKRKSNENKDTSEDDEKTEKDDIDSETNLLANLNNLKRRHSKDSGGSNSTDASEGNDDSSKDAVRKKPLKKKIKEDEPDIGISDILEDNGCENNQGS